MLALVHWDGGPSGTGTDWNIAANWAGDVLPGPDDDVVIDVPADVTIVHGSGTNSIKSLSSRKALTLTGGTLDVAGTVQVDNTFTLNGGTLANATVLPGSGGQRLSILSNSANCLTGVTVNGDLDLSVDYADLKIQGETTICQRALEWRWQRDEFRSGAHVDGEHSVGGVEGRSALHRDGCCGDADDWSHGLHPGGGRLWGRRPRGLLE